MVELTEKTLSTETILAGMQDPSTGAVVLFLGTVRDHAEGKTVTHMDYEAYNDMAIAKMKVIEAETITRWPIRQIAIIHRIGALQLGDISVAVAVASPHRNEAFEACRFAIDTLKRTVPIWKKEYSPNGDAWVGGVIPQIRKK